MSVFLEWLIFRVIYTLISHLNDPIVLIFPLVTWNSDPAQELCMCLCRKRYVTQLFYLSYFRDTEANTYHSVTIVFPETNLSSILSVCFVAFWVGSKNVDWTLVAEIAISHVSGYFWIRKFFFPDWNVSPSTRSEKIHIRCRFSPDACERKPYLDHGKKKLRIQKYPDNCERGKSRALKTWTGPER